jgi:hypothetical protein
LKATVPVGVPLVVVTVAVRFCVIEELPRAIEDGLTDTLVVVVAAAAGVTVTVVCCELPL